MSTSETFLLAMIVILSVPYAVWRLGNTDYYAPLVVVQIVGGILLGPGVLGAAFPEYYKFLFNAPVVQALNGIAWWAVMLFVWLAGLELDLAAAWRHRQESLITAGLALGMPLLAGCIAAAAIVRTQGWMGASGERWQFVLGVGMACAVTALPILILFMEKLQILRLPLGQRILRYASLDDIAIWGVLATILLDWQRVGRQVGFLAAFALCAWGFRAWLPRLAMRDRWYLSIIWLAACGFSADWSGLHFMVGAFLAGAVLDRQWFSEEQLDSLRNNILLTIMPVFFLSTGLRTNWNVGSQAVFLVAAVLLVASVTGKLLGVHVAGKILRWQRGEASVIGWLLQTKALIMIIFVSILLDRHIITNEMFTALLLMAVGSTMLSVPAATPMLRRLKSLAQRPA